LPAISGLAFLQISYYIINIVTGIINEPRKLDFQTSWNLSFPPLEPETSLFWLDASVDFALTGQLYDKFIQPVYL
jgi:hypothetical protein